MNKIDKKVKVVIAIIMIVAMGVTFYNGMYYGAVKTCQNSGMYLAKGWYCEEYKIDEPVPESAYKLDIRF